METTTANKTHDELVQELFNKFQQKKESIEKAKKPVWETGGVFSYSPNSAHDRTDIKTVTDQRKLVEMFGFILDRKEKTEAAASQLGVKYSFNWLGFSEEEWKKDFQTRIDQLQLQEKIKELEEIEVRLNSVISPELRRQMELEALSKALA